MTQKDHMTFARMLNKQYYFVKGSKGHDMYVFKNLVDEIRRLFNENSDFFDDDQFMDVVFTCDAYK